MTISVAECGWGCCDTKVNAGSSQWEIINCHWCLWLWVWLWSHTWISVVNVLANVFSVGHFLSLIVFPLLNDQAWSYYLVILIISITVQSTSVLVTCFYLLLLLPLRSSCKVKKTISCAPTQESHFSTQNSTTTITEKHCERFAELISWISVVLSHLVGCNRHITERYTL